jgi:hypothetical protein
VRLKVAALFLGPGKTPLRLEFSLESSMRSAVFVERDHCRHTLCKERGESPPVSPRIGCSSYELKTWAAGAKGLDPLLEASEEPSKVESETWLR